ncbi:MAG TPA: chemotaxis protein CheC [Clostridiaceae bacterium]|nr:chemotaxis protein CheC [Clostridiaceae bacterium]
MVFNIDNLSHLHLDVLREIGNIGAGNAVTALAKMLDKKVDMDVPKVKILEFKDVGEILGEAETLVVGILLNVSGDITGSMMFIIEHQSAHILVNMLMGKPVDSFDDFTEIEVSALKEIGNILASSYLTALSELTGLKAYPSIPDIAIDMAGAILSVPAIEFGKVGDTVLYIEAVFTEGNNKVRGDFFLVPDIESYEILLKALGVIS